VTAQATYHRLLSAAATKRGEFAAPERLPEPRDGSAEKLESDFADFRVRQIVPDKAALFMERTDLARPSGDAA